MKNILTLVLLISGMHLFAQTAPPPPPPPPAVQCDTCKPAERVLSFAEEMPHFPGGENGFQKYLQQNVHYPDSAKKYGRQGTVYVYFEVYHDGSIQNVRCQKGVPNAPELCEEAVRVISAMPNWEPGKMDRKNVTVSMTVPLRFTLD